MSRLLLPGGFLISYKAGFIHAHHCRPVSRLGLAYAGSNREDVLSLLLPVMGDSKSSMEVWTVSFMLRLLLVLDMLQLSQF